MEIIFEMERMKLNEINQNSNPSLTSKIKFEYINKEKRKRRQTTDSLSSYLSFVLLN